MTHLGGTSGPMAQVHNAESQPLTDQPEHGRGLAPYQRRSTLSAAEEHAPIGEPNCRQVIIIIV
jgi:hypothetical protein